jgi:hypothetical protein
MSNYRPLQEFFSSPAEAFDNSASYEYKNRSVSKGAQFIPMGIPTDYWKT